jgi:hypothetical protein
VPEQLFVFIQFEFPWMLGPAEGRYLLRSEAGGEPERVVVLGALGAPRLPLTGRPPGARSGPLAARRARRMAKRPATPGPAPVTTTRATVIDPVSLPAESQARAWLADIDSEREVLAAGAVVNRVLQAHRVAAADPYVHEVSPGQALVIRAGFGAGEQVADGNWMDARELPATGRGRGRGRRRDRSATLRPQERLAALLGGRHEMLLCEELTLRARLDLDQGRTAHGAIQLRDAYSAALRELPTEDRQDLAIRVAELEKLRALVDAQADAAIAGAGGGTKPAPGLDTEALTHALGRLEAALRARTAAGIS